MPYMAKKKFEISVSIDIPERMAQRYIDVAQAGRA